MSVDDDEKDVSFTHVPYANFMEFRGLTEKFRVEMQAIIKAKVEEKFWLWQRNPSRLRFNLVDVMKKKLATVTKGHCVEWCQGVSVNLDNVLRHTGSAIFTLQMLQRDFIVRLAAFNHSVQAQFQMAVTDNMNMLQFLNFHMVPQVGLLTTNEINERKLAVCMALHWRLGSLSSMALLDRDCLQDIAQLSVR